MTLPELTHVAAPDLGANQEGHTLHRDAYLSMPILVREARKVVEDQRLSISGSRLRKLVRRFVDDGRTDLDLRTWIICYADPTGEAAVRNLDRIGWAETAAERELQRGGHDG